MSHLFWRRAAMLGIAFATTFWSCDKLRTVVPDSPYPAPPPLVSVTIEYRQPNGCSNVLASCDDRVVFFGSWMQQVPGVGVVLTRDSDNYTWRGVAHGVPVNFPPNDDPYRVQVYDPHLRDSLPEGFTAERLTVGGQFVTRIYSSEGVNEYGLMYIDANGRGRSPY